jgi:hypothetical protein
MRLKKRRPEDVKIRYGIQQATGGSFGEWTMRILAKRCGVKPPELYKKRGLKSIFVYPNKIYLSKTLYGATVENFVGTCIHEFAHYLDLGQLTRKECLARKQKHDKNFVKWIGVVSRAAFKSIDGEKFYPWETDYTSVVRIAAKLGYVKIREKK